MPRCAIQEEEEDGTMPGSQSLCCGILPDVRTLPNLHCLTRMMTTMMALQSKMQDTGGEHREDCTESFFNTTPALDQAEARCGYAALASVELRQGHGVLFFVP